MEGVEEGNETRKNAWRRMNRRWRKGGRVGVKRKTETERRANGERRKWKVGKKEKRKKGKVKRRRNRRKRKERN